jgi:malate/lactate dehydrogenase
MLGLLMSSLFVPEHLTWLLFLRQVAEHLAIGVSSVRNVIVWGNATSMQVPDVEHGTVMGVPMQNVVDDEFVAELTVAVQQRNNIIVRVRISHARAPAEGCIARQPT